jgi:hypothetical protein
VIADRPEKSSARLAIQHCLVDSIYFYIFCFIFSLTMNQKTFEKLHDEGLLSDESFLKIKSTPSQKLLSVHWEIRTILYLGVLLLASGLGILVYKNIDTIGHQAVLIFIALLSFSGFYYCFKNKYPYTPKKTEAPNSFFDSVLFWRGKRWRRRRRR